MSMPVITEQDYNFIFENTTGGELAIGTFHLKNGQFGNVVSLVEADKTSPPAPVPDNEEMLVDCAPARIVQIPDAQLDAGDTYTKHNKVYMEPGAGDIVDAPTASTWYIGIVVQEKGTGTSIRIKTVQPIEETTP